MKITVIGATGRTGRHVLAQGVRRGLNRLTDQPGRGGLSLSRDLLDRPASIPRTDAAAGLLDVVEAGHHVQAAVNASPR